jgi:Na+/phosphate symporter
MKRKRAAKAQTRASDQLVNLPIELPAAAAPAAESLPQPNLFLRIARHIDWRKITLFIISLVLFILAIILMKEGAQSLTPLIRDRFTINNPLNSLGFGWLFAYLIMSGSPVAASALTFYDAGALSQLSTFTMITGSRFGAGLIVLIIGFVYILRGRDRASSLSMGLLSLFVTITTYLCASLIGAALLQAGVLDSFRIASSDLFDSLVDIILGSLVSFLRGFMPQWMLFPLGLLIIMFSFTLFDKCLPQMSLKESRFGQVSRLVYRPAVMFLLGAAVTLLSMSVTLSLSLLVPLSERGFVRRENAIPYIMGANITTFIDTLFASLLLDNPGGFTVVAASMISITLVSLFVMILILRPYERLILQGVDWTTANNLNLAIFLGAALTLPLILLLL